MTKKEPFKSPPTGVRVARVPRRQMLWTNEQMELAMKAVKVGSFINQAALDHGIPPTTLKDRTEKNLGLNST